MVVGTPSLGRCRQGSVVVAGQEARRRDSKHLLEIQIGAFFRATAALATQNEPTVNSAAVAHIPECSPARCQSNEISIFIHIDAMGRDIDRGRVPLILRYARALAKCRQNTIRQGRALASANAAGEKSAQGGRSVGEVGGRVYHGAWYYIINDNRGNRGNPHKGHKKDENNATPGFQERPYFRLDFHFSKVPRAGGSICKM
ncbi:hypothetical protein B0T17DRAFT_543852, partial [Bombardia bombarda]